MLAKSGARPQVDRVFPFEQLPEAFERLRGGPMGKVLMRVKPWIEPRTLSFVGPGKKV